MLIYMFEYFFPLVFLLLLVIVLPLFFKLLSIPLDNLFRIIKFSLWSFVCVTFYCFITLSNTFELLPTNLLYYFSFNNLYLFISLINISFILFIIYHFRATPFLFYNIWLLLILIFGLNLILIANNLIFLLFSLELVSLTIIILLSLYSSNAKSANNILNYFLLNSFISGFFYFSVFLSFILNTYQFEFIFWAYLYNKTTVVNTLLLLIFLFKLGVAPVHFIQLSVYENLPWYIFFFILKIYKFILFLTFCNFSYLFITFQTNLFYIGMLSVIFGAVQPFWSYSLRNLLFSSSLFVYGNALLLLSLNERIIAINFVLIYTIGSTFLFLLLIYYENKYTFSFDFLNNINVNGLPSLHFSLFLCSWFLSGIPPTIFFFYKASLIENFFIHLGTGYTLFLILIFIIGTIGYFRLIKIFLFDFQWTKITLSNIFNLFNFFVINTILIFFFSDLLNLFLLKSTILFYANLFKYL